MGIFGGRSSSTASSVASEASDFADFAASTVSTVANAAASVVSSAASSFSGTSAEPTSRPIRPSVFGDAYPWYAFWKRVGPSDFYMEYFVLVFLGVIVGLYYYGASANRSLARKWILQHVPVLQREYARVGFQRVLTTTAEVESAVAAGELVGNPNDLYKEDTPSEFVHHDTGRLNVISTVFRINLQSRHNPFIWAGETVLAFFFDSMPAQTDTVTVTTYPSDGSDAAKTGGSSSKYDGFIWAIVNKRTMAKWRTARYDMSLTRTVDSTKLPSWLTVMTESAEITDMLLSKDLISAVEKVGNNFQYLLITDQPLDKPEVSTELVNVKKRITLVLDIQSKDDSAALIEYFTRLPDFLVANAHFRPEVNRKLRATRDEERRRLEKGEEEKKAEERNVTRDEKKKADRDAKLRGLSAEEQKRFLEKEKEKEARKMAKKQQKRV